MLDSTVDTKLFIGDQILYIPDHAEGNPDHPDVEVGFVTSFSQDGDAFCRYWSKYAHGELRTKSCSELTPRRNLVRRDTRPQKEIERLLEELGYGR